MINLHSRRISDPPSSHFDTIYGALSSEFKEIDLFFNANPSCDRPHWHARFFLKIGSDLGTFIDLLDKRKGSTPFVVIHSSKWREPVAPVAEVYIVNLLGQLKAKYEVKKGVYFGD
jgi:hypothetical protein